MILQTTFLDLHNTFSMTNKGKSKLKINRGHRLTFPSQIQPFLNSYIYNYLNYLANISLSLKFNINLMLTKSTFHSNAFREFNTWLLPTTRCNVRHTYLYLHCIVSFVPNSVFTFSFAKSRLKKNDFIMRRIEQSPHLRFHCTLSKS